MSLYIHLYVSIDLLYVNVFLSGPLYPQEEGQQQEKTTEYPNNA